MGDTRSLRGTVDSRHQILVVMAEQPIETDNKECDRAMVGEQGVTYGLQIRAQSERRKPAPKRNVGVFGDESSDSEAEADGASAPPAAGCRKGNAANLVVGKMLARQMAAIDKNEKVKKSQEEALREDGSVFDYDAHVDAIQAARRKKVEARQQEKVDRKSKYIAGLLETAEHRKKEQEVLFEKRLEKEREAEEEIYGTKEKFVTGAYRRKLEEEEKWKLEQEKKREEDEANAVEKRGSMAGFYSNYLDVVSGKAEPVPSPQKEYEKVEHARGVTEGEGMAGAAPAGADGKASAEGEVGGLAVRASPPQPPRAAEAEIGAVRSENVEEEPAARAARLKREREEKIAEARRRYKARLEERDGILHEVANQP